MNVGNLFTNYEEAVAMILFGIGFSNLLLQKNLIKKIIGLNIMDTAMYLFLALIYLMPAVLASFSITLTSCVVMPPLLRSCLKYELPVHFCTAFWAVFMRLVCCNVTF